MALCRTPRTSARMTHNTLAPLQHTGAGTAGRGAQQQTCRTSSTGARSSLAKTYTSSSSMVCSARIAPCTARQCRTASTTLPVPASPCAQPPGFERRYHARRRGAAAPSRHPGASKKPGHAKAASSTHCIRHAPCFIFVPTLLFRCIQHAMRLLHRPTSHTSVAGGATLVFHLTHHG